MANKKKEKTKIDIILPNYNSSQFIVRTIKSILDQTYKNWKLIIVDDFKEVFKSKKRSNCAPPAPACGLYLSNIKY